MITAWHRTKSHCGRSVAPACPRHRMGIPRRNRGRLYKRWYPGGVHGPKRQGCRGPQGHSGDSARVGLASRLHLGSAELSATGLQLQCGGAAREAIRRLSTQDREVREAALYGREPGIETRDGLCVDCLDHGGTQRQVFPALSRHTLRFSRVRGATKAESTPYTCSSCRRIISDERSAATESRYLDAGPTATETACLAWNPTDTVWYFRNRNSYEKRHEDIGARSNHHSQAAQRTLRHESRRRSRDHADRERIAHPETNSLAASGGQDQRHLGRRRCRPAHRRDQGQVITAVDTNVLLDVCVSHAPHYAQSRQ